MKYLIGFKVETTIRSHLKSSKFSHSGSTIELKFPKQNTGEIDAFVELSSKTSAHAYDKAYAILEEFVDAASYIMDSSLYVSRPFVILKNERNKKIRHALRKTYRDEYGGFYMKSDTKQSIDQVLNILEEDNNISLCLRWFRYGHRARTIIEQFLYYWLSVERLVGEVDIVNKCKECGFEDGYHAITSKNGIRELINKHNQNLTNKKFNQIWSARQKVFHGGIKIDPKFGRKLAEYSGIIRQTLFNELGSLVQTERKIKLSKSIGSFRRFTIDAFYKFTTLDPSQPYALDYPTDEQIEIFQQTSEVKSEDGFELVNFDHKKNLW